MKIFISWSGDLSFKIAKLLKRWLKCVLQATDPWISSDDIDKGSIWFNEITRTLDDCKIGIVCLTKTNINAPWILFEAGNLLKGLNSNRVCTFLVDLEPKDIEPPLSQFNHTSPDRDSIFKLVSTLNELLNDVKLDIETLTTVFNIYWPYFESDFKLILNENQEDNTPASIRSNDDILTEILYSVRSLDSRINNLENDFLINTLTYKHNEVAKERPLTDNNINKKYTKSINKYNKGDLVFHPSFGNGVVQKSQNLGNDNLIIIRFEDNGVKNIVQSVAEQNGLKKIE